MAAIGLVINVAGVYVLRSGSKESLNMTERKLLLLVCLGSLPISE